MLHIVWFPLYEMSGIVNLLETESRLVVAGSWGRGVKEDCIVGTEFTLGDENVCNWMEVVFAQLCEGTKYHQIVHF